MSALLPAVDRREVERCRDSMHTRMSNQDVDITKAGKQSGGMRDARSTFPLRFRQERLRALMREVAAREGISQNELVEQAVEHEVVARGAMLAADLTDAAERLRRATDAQHADLVARSIEEFAAGEQQRDPLRAFKLELRSDEADPLGVVAAFRGANA